ncbi:membrane-bound O-acyltransferase gup1-like isoform X1 [Musa acuminata AAA Group]|uniref:membrane-bound O-acyltransferase gup1-like isoform X1 n=1 Tax=Musa acuminata AAA Group TaxID=214697 RepID=UPI0031DFB6AB
MRCRSFRQWELGFLLLYAAAFYAIVIDRSLHLSNNHYEKLRGLRPGWISGRLNDISDAQWRNFRENLPILTVVLGFFTIVANILRYWYNFKGRGMSFIWILTSLSYLLYLHGACVGYIISIASLNFFMAKVFARSKYYLGMLWVFNLAVLIVNRIFEGYSFSLFGQQLAFLDNYRGTFRWHICFNLVILRMISYGCDYHWSYKKPLFDQKKHMQRCNICSSGKTCYFSLQERSIHGDKYSFSMYLCYLIYAPLYIAGPIVSFNAFATQMDMPQKNYSLGQIIRYGLKWILNLLLMEAMTHFFYYNAFAVSGSWRHLSPLEILIIGYGVLNFMWLKFFLIWRYFTFWSLMTGIETPENMPRCINNCYDLETFWKSWHASFNKWLVRYMYIPLGGSQRKLLNVWVIFTFVAVWHDLEWKLLSWAWLTCIFFAPEILIKSCSNAVQVRSAFGMCIQRELSAIAGAVTISCLMVANLAGFVMGPSGIKWLISRLLHRDGLPILAGTFTTFYVGTKLMFHIRDAKKCNQLKDH